jgi:hypothetical protein
MLSQPRVEKTSPLFIPNPIQRNPTPLHYTKLLTVPPFKYPIHPVSITKDYVRCQAEYVDETLLFNINQASILLMYREMGQTHLAFQLN